MSAGRRARLAQEALERGAEHHRAGRWAEAARAYAEALKEQPENVDALALLGGAALRMGRPADALAVLERAVALDGGHALARLNQGRALLALERGRTRRSLSRRRSGRGPGSWRLASGGHARWR